MKTISDMRSDERGIIAMLLLAIFVIVALLVGMVIFALMWKQIIGLLLICAGVYIFISSSVPLPANAKVAGGALFAILGILLILFL